MARRISDLTGEDLITLQSVAKRAKVSESSMKRWVLSGVSGVQLEVTRCGGVFRTSWEAFARFNAAIEWVRRGDVRPMPKRMTERQRQRADEAADRYLDAMGV